MDAIGIMSRLSPWLLLGGFISVPLAYWRDSRNQSLDELRYSRKKTLLLVSSCYGSLIIGSLATARLGEQGIPFYVLSWFLSVILAIAGLITGAATRGWTRVAAVISSMVMLFVMIFWAAHCDL